MSVYSEEIQSRAVDVAGHAISMILEMPIIDGRHLPYAVHCYPRSLNEVSSGTVVVTSTDGSKEYVRQTVERGPGLIAVGE